MSRSRTLHLTDSLRTLFSRKISAKPSVRTNSASWLKGMRSPLGALTMTLRSLAVGSPGSPTLTTKLKRRSCSKISVTARPLVAASIVSWMSWTLMP